MLSHTFSAHWLFNMPLTTEEELDLAHWLLNMPLTTEEEIDLAHWLFNMPLTTEEEIDLAHWLFNMPLTTEEEIDLAHWLFNMPLTTEEEIDLAEEVRKFPTLYDKKKSQYHEREVVRNCWKEVAATLGFESGDIAKRCFDNLRKRFTKGRHKIKITKRSGASRCVKVALTMYPPKLNFCANT